MDDRNQKSIDNRRQESIRKENVSKNSIESRQHNATLNQPNTPTPSSSFISALDDRLKASNIDKQGWRGRDDLHEIMNDLRTYAQHDRTGAHAMWRKYVPDEIAIPPALEASQIKEQASNSDTSKDKNAEDSNVIDFERALQKRYLKAGNSYYYRDDTDTIAFEDKDQKLTTEHNDPTVIKSMIELAIAKGWQELDLKGSDEFKREAWLTASINNIKTNGYSPRQVDIAKLEELQQEQKRQTLRSNSTIAHKEVVDERKLSESQAIAIQTFSALLHRRGDSPEQISAALEEAKNRFQDKRVYVGKIIDHGSSPYEFNKKNEDSYFVKLESNTGQQQTVWGIDLKRAISESNAKTGDDIALAHQGKEVVKVVVKERDNAGQETSREIEAIRNNWAASKVEQIRSDALAKLSLAAEKTKQQPVVRVFDHNAQHRNITRSMERNQQAKTRAR